MHSQSSISQTATNQHSNVEALKNPSFIQQANTSEGPSKFDEEALHDIIGQMQEASPNTKPKG